YRGWEMVDYAAVSIAESATLMLTPGRRCENGKPVPINDPDWIKFTQQLADAGKAAYRASQTRNQENASDSTNQLNDSCLSCHRVGPGKNHSRESQNILSEPLLWRGNVIRCHAALESPVAVLFNQDIVVAARLRDDGFAVGAWRDESPSRPRGRAVAVGHDFEV